jgi:hypothetical protein
MANLVPFQDRKTGNPDLDRLSQDVAQAVRDLQTQRQPATSVTITSSFSLGRQATATVSPETRSSVVVSLPNVAPANQVSRIVNNSAFPVQVRTADSLTVFGAVQPGASLTVTGNGKTWSA